MLYLHILKSRPYLYLELKKAAQLKIQEFDEYQIKMKAIDENIFAVNTEARKREIAYTVINRILELDEYICERTCILVQLKYRNIK